MKIRSLQPSAHAVLAALALLAIAIALVVASPARAETPIFEIVIKDHKFEPAEVVIPAETKVKLVVKNLDPTPEEFESFDFNREKIIPGGAQAVIFVGPLAPGRYNFFGEFNMDTAQGYLVVE